MNNNIPDSLAEENEWLRRVVAEAAALIVDGAALMTDAQLSQWHGHGVILAVANQMDLGEYPIRALDVAYRHMAEDPRP